MTGGCSAFGHSCFGGHGKRSGDSPPIDVSFTRLNNRYHNFLKIDYSFIYSQKQ